MPPPSGSGKIDYRFIQEGGISYQNLSDEAIRLLFDVPTIVLSIKHETDSWTIITGNPSRILITVQNATVSQNSAVAGFKTEGFVVNEGPLSIIELYNSEGDPILSGNDRIYGRLDNISGNLLNISLYRDYQLQNTFDGSSFSNVLPDNRILFILPKRISIRNCTNFLLRNDFQVGILSDEQATDIKNLQAFVGASENQTFPNFSNEPNNLNFQTNLVNAIKYINSSVIGNLNQLSTQAKTSLVNAINSVVEYGTSQTEYIKRVVVGGIVDNPEVTVQNNEIYITPNNILVWDKNTDRSQIINIPIPLPIADNNVFIWNGAAYVNPDADFSNKRFLIFLNSQNWNIFFVEVSNNNNLLGTFGMEPELLYSIGIVLISRASSAYIAHSVVSAQNRFVYERWKGIEKGIYYSSNYKGEIVRGSGNNNEVQYNIYIRDNYTQFFIEKEIKTAGNITGKIYDITEVSGNISRQKIEIPETNVHTSINTIQLVNTIATSSGYSPEFLMQYKRTPAEAQVRISSNSDNYIEIKNDVINIGASGQISISGNIYLNNIPWSDGASSFPSGFSSLVHAIQEINNQSLVSKVFILRGKVVSVTGSVAVTNISWSNELQLSNYDKTITIRGDEYFVSNSPNTPDNDTAIIYEDSGNVVVQYPSSLTPQVNDRIIIKFWRKAL